MGRENISEKYLQKIFAHEIYIDPKTLHPFPDFSNMLNKQNL